MELDAFESGLSDRTTSVAGHEDIRFVDGGGTAPGDRTFRPDIEGLRAVAVLLVVLYHSGDLHLVGGFVGVDAFFVISGFVITGVLLRKSTSTGKPQLLAFYSHRVLRIVPMATVVIASAMVAERVVFGAATAAKWADGAKWAALFSANIRPTFLLGTYWSLAVEEQFYLVYPALLLLLAVFGRRWTFRVKIGVLLGTTIVASLTWAVLHPVAAYTSPFGRAWELAVGASIAAATAQLKKLPTLAAAAMTWCGLIGLIVVAELMEYTSSYSGTFAVLPVLAAALIIAGGTAAPQLGAESVLKLAPFRWIGRWSYSLYLWHWPVILIAAQHWGYMSGLRKGGLALFSLGLSATTYFLIENPIRRSALLTRTPFIGLAFGAVLVASCLAVITLVS